MVSDFYTLEITVVLISKIVIEKQVPGSNCSQLILNYTKVQRHFCLYQSMELIKLNKTHLNVLKIGTQKTYKLNFFLFCTSRYWKCLLSPLMLRGAALFSCIMSVLIIWSEVNLFFRLFFTNAFRERTLGWPRL